MGEDFIQNDDVLVLGDNILRKRLSKEASRRSRFCKTFKKCKVFGYYVNDPERYGVVEFDNEGRPISIEEKPSNQKVTMLSQGYIFIQMA